MALQLSVRPKPTFILPLFLAPAFATSASASPLGNPKTFSTSFHLNERQRQKERNRKRGVSVMRSTGPRVPTSVYYKYKELPQPVLDPAQRKLKEFPTNQDHGLYGFFNKERDTVLLDTDESAHGRSWTYQELAKKSFDELHALYWLGIKEMNQIATRKLELQRLKLGFGAVEQDDRMKIVEETNENIRTVLRDRQYAFDEVHVMINKGHRIDELLGEGQEFEEYDPETTIARNESFAEATETQDASRQEQFLKQQQQQQQPQA